MLGSGLMGPFFFIKAIPTKDKSPNAKGIRDYDITRINEKFG
jgi:hypothetical protein